jgi:cytochrome c-type biogenesis protein CcmE
MKSNAQTYKIAIAIFVILGAIAYLSISAEQSTKSYYVTIQQLQAMGNKAYTRNLRVAGNVVPGSIVRHGPNADFTLYEQNRKLRVEYVGEQPPPDTFKGNIPAMAVGTYGRDGIFHATQLQAKCASHYGTKKTEPNTQMAPTAKKAPPATSATAMAVTQPKVH